MEHAHLIDPFVVSHRFGYLFRHLRPARYYFRLLAFATSFALALQTALASTAAHSSVRLLVPGLLFCVNVVAVAGYHRTPVLIGCMDASLRRVVGPRFAGCGRSCSSGATPSPPRAACCRFGFAPNAMQ
jgi:hypothetical protein